MRLEHIPLILGVIVALIGLGFIADASMAAAAPVTPERRRRIRAEPSRAGEAIVGIGTLCMAAALFGRDTWRYGTVAVLLGSVLLLIGVILNRAFLKEALLFRGPARRAEGGAPPVRRGQPASPAPRPTPAPPPASARPPEPAARAGGPPANVRHPTPPLASRAYKPAEPAVPSPSPGAGPARPDVPPPTAREPDSRHAASAPKPATSPLPKPPGETTPGPKERRKTPRGKR